MTRYLGAMDRIIATSPNYLATSEILNEFLDKVEVIPIGLEEPTFPSLDEHNTNVTEARARYGQDFFIGVHSNGVVAQFIMMDQLWLSSRIIDIPFKQVAMSTRRNNTTIVKSGLYILNLTVMTDH